MIRIENLTKVYKLSKRQMQKQKTKLSTKIAVNDVSLTANAGEIFGLLGPNGAGKTTTLRCLATLLKPTDGRITIDDIDVVEQPDKIREKLGFLTGEIKLDDQFSVNYLVEFFGRLHGIPEDILKRYPDTSIRIPMIGDTRSLNLSNSVAIVLYEALRQNNFEGMRLEGEPRTFRW